MFREIQVTLFIISFLLTPAAYAGKGDGINGDDEDFQMHSCLNPGLNKQIEQEGTLLGEVVGKLEQPSVEHVIFFPGSFSPPHKGHFDLLRIELLRHPKSDVVIVYNDETRDFVDPNVGKEIWEKYYFSLLSHEFPDSHLSIERASGGDPHDHVFRIFKKQKRYKNATVIAGADRTEYADRLKLPKKKREMNELENAGRSFVYHVSRRDEKAPSAISATRLRECLRTSIVTGSKKISTAHGANQSLIKNCRAFFPAQLPEPAFLEAANWIVNRMSHNMKSDETHSGSPPSKR